MQASFYRQNSGERTRGILLFTAPAGGRRSVGKWFASLGKSEPLLETAAQRYGAAFCLVSVAFGMRWVLHPLIAQEARWIIFLPAILAAAIVAGSRAALFATVLSTGLSLIFIGIAPKALPAAVLSLVYVSAGASLAWLYAALRQSRRQRAAESSVPASQALAMNDTGSSIEALAEQLSTASAMAAAGAISSNMAHELMQPLAAITNYATAAEMMLEGHTDAQSVNARAALVKAVAQVKRASETVDRMRNLMRNEACDRSEESVASVIEEAAALAHATVPCTGLRLRLQFDHRVTTVHVDRIQIQQVLLNLIRNAMEAVANSRRREILVSTRLVAGELEISVTDSGPGVSGDILPQIFEPFVTTKSNGIGVGLSISRMIVKTHGGRIWAESGSKGGAIFRFTLPVNA